MIGATLFSGIGAPEVAMPHWRWPWHAEIEKFPCAVMAQRHPQSVNLGDVSAHDFTDRAGAIARPDVLVFGSPCQSYSVAGKRLGLDDPRGNLALVALGIVDRLKPRWFVFENVPGLLSSSEGRDFGLFLRTVDELGYSLVWTVLDAQHFGVAQRRQRVFAVGYLGDWRYPAAVLLEPESLCGNHPPRREAGKGTTHGLAPSLTCSGRGVERPGESRGQDPVVAVCGTLNANGKAAGSATQQDAESGMLIAAFGGNNTDGPIDVASARNAHGGPHGRLDFESETFVAAIPILEAGARTGKSTDDIRAGIGIGEAGDPMFTLQSGKQHAIAFDTTQITSKGNYSNPREGEPCHPLAATAHVPAVAWSIMPQNSSRDYKARQVDVAQPLMAGGPVGGNQGGDYIQQSAVRRLTPRECERLQGFPDDYTLITYRGKPAADGPRYKTLGNSMCTKVMRWILGRIESVDALADVNAEAAE